MSNEQTCSNSNFILSNHGSKSSFTEDEQPTSSDITNNQLVEEFRSRGFWCEPFNDLHPNDPMFNEKFDYIIVTAERRAKGYRMLVRDLD